MRRDPIEELNLGVEVTAPRVQPVEAHKNVVKSASSGQRALGLLLRVAVLYVAVLVFGPALPGAPGIGGRTGAVRRLVCRGPGGAPRPRRGGGGRGPTGNSWKASVTKESRNR